jgi:hypothetical protein
MMRHWPLLAWRRNQPADGFRKTEEAMVQVWIIDGTDAARDRAQLIKFPRY